MLVFFLGIGIIVLLITSAILIKRNDHYHYETYSKYSLSRLASHKSTRKLAILLFLSTSVFESFFLIELSKYLYFDNNTVVVSVLVILSLPFIAITAKWYNSFLHLFTAFLYYFMHLLLFLIISDKFLAIAANISLVLKIVLILGMIVTLAKVLRKPYKISGNEEILSMIPIGISIFIISIFMLTL